MKKLALLLPLFIFFYLGCKDNAVNNNTPSVYSGNFAGLSSQNKEVEIEVGKVGGIEFVTRYKLVAIFYHGSGSTTLTLSKTNSDGLASIQGNYFKIKLDDQDTTQFLQGLWSSQTALTGSFLVKTQLPGDTLLTASVGTYTAVKK